MGINSKDLVALQKIDKDFGQSRHYFCCYYIFPNGHFINPDNPSDSEYCYDIDSLTYEHEDFDNWAFNYIGKGYYHLFSDYCMKMNTTYPYVMIPIQRWTPEQIKSFREIVEGRDFEYAWGDIQSHIYYNGGKQDISKMEEPLMIESFNDDFAVSFDLAYTSADDIIKAINRYYSTGVMLTEDIKKSAILELNRNNEKKFIDEFVRGKDTKELLSIAKLMATSESNFNGAEFILPNGELLNATYNDYAVHNDVAYAILYDCIESSGVEFNAKTDGYAWLTNSYLTDELGWVRVNYGNSLYKNGFYCVLPDRSTYGALNSAQYDKLLDFFDFGYYESDFDGVMIYCGANGSGGYNSYSFKEYIPEEIIKKIKRYYATGELLESKKRKKKPHYNVQVSTGDVAANIKSFNSMMGGFGESLNEAKADIDAFVDKFGEDTYNNFLKAKDRLKNKGQSVDLTWYVKNMEKKDLDELIISLYGKDTDRQKKRIIQGTDKEIRGKYNYLGEKDGYKVYQPLDVQASMDLGVNTGWCTAGRYGHYGHPEFTPSFKDAKQHWDSYTNSGIKFYYFLDPKTMYGKYALALYPEVLNSLEDMGGEPFEGGVQLTNFEVYNAEDDLDYSIVNELPLDLIKEELVLEMIPSDEQGLAISNSSVIGCEEDAVNVTIPDSVKSIGESAFSGCSSLKSIIIPDSVTSIRYSAFEYCSSLTSVTIPDSVKSIGESAFSGCSSLKSIIIGNGVKSIGYDVFSDCKSLTSVTIPDSVKSIGNLAFSHCSSLTSITIGNGVIIIEDSVFRNCTSLKSITIGNGVKWIGGEAFYGCPKDLIVYTNNEYAINYCKDNKIEYKPITNESLQEKVSPQWYEPIHRQGGDKTFKELGLQEGYKQPETFFKLTDDEAVWTDEGEDWHYWSSEAGDWEETYAKAYKCKMSPKDFLDLTTSKGADSLKLGDDVWGELKELDVDKFVKQSQPIYLDIWFDDKNNNHKAKVVGHEGRHRMFALMQRGIKKVDVVLFVREWDTEYDKYHPFDIDWVILTGQFNKSVRKIVEPISPMSWKKHQEIRPNVRELKNYKNV